jgi:calcium-dependent protein kinase
MALGCLAGICNGCVLGGGRSVGRERKHKKLLRKASSIERGLGVADARERPLRETSVDGGDFCWEGTLRVSAKVSKRSTSFASEFELSNIALGEGMSGCVYLARPRRPLSCFEELTEEDPEVDDDAAARESPARPPQQDSATASTAGHHGFASATGADRLRMPAPSRLAGWSRHNNHDLVAVKTLDKAGLTKEQLQRLLLEVDIHLKMDHVNIAKLLRVFDERDKVYLITENCSGGSLADELVCRGNFSERDAADAVCQMLSAVRYCHGHPNGKICHRDLKHSNFIYASIAANAPLKLVDFGLSRVITPVRPRKQKSAGTISYMAPEVIFNRKYDESCDIWAIGVITYSLLCGRPLFHGGTTGDVATAIARCDLSSMDSPGLWAGVSDGAKQFIRQLLQVDPSRRPTVEQAILSPWLVAQGAASRMGTTSRLRPCREVLDRVRHFAHENALRRAAAAVLVYSRSAPTCDTLRRLEAQFRVLDADGNGMISAQELVQAYRETHGLAEEEAAWIFNQLDMDGDNEVHHSEFLTAALGLDLLKQKDTVQEVFSRFDLDNDGKIDRQELFAVLGPCFCGTPTHEIFDELDKNGDCVIDLDEFSSMLSNGLAEDSRFRRVSSASTISSAACQPESEPPPSG